MEALLRQLYQQMKLRYAIGSRTWDDFHVNVCNQGIWLTDAYILDPSFQQEYEEWRGLVNLLKEYKIPYYQGIDIFLEEYAKVLTELILETNGGIME